jgi:hypothetical protein
VRALCFGRGIEHDISDEFDDKQHKEKTMKKISMLGAIAAVVITQAGCGTQVRSVPLQSVQSAAQQTTANGGVSLYFGSQEHPAVKTQLGEANYSVRIARGQGGPDDSCNSALSEALSKLRADAQAHGANAVVDVQTRFHTTETSSATNFTCGVSPSAAAVAVRGNLVVLQNN